MDTIISINISSYRCCSCIPMHISPDSGRADTGETRHRHANPRPGTRAGSGVVARCRMAGFEPVIEGRRNLACYPRSPCQNRPGARPGKRHPGRSAAETAGRRNSSGRIRHRHPTYSRSRVPAAEAAPAPDRPAPRWRCCNTDWCAPPAAQAPSATATHSRPLPTRKACSLWVGTAGSLEQGEHGRHSGSAPGPDMLE